MAIMVATIKVATAMPNFVRDRTVRNLWQQTLQPLEGVLIPNCSVCLFAAYCWHSPMTAIVLPAALQPRQPPCNTLQRPPPTRCAAVLLLCLHNSCLQEQATTSYHNQMTAALPCAPTVNQLCIWAPQ